MINLIFKKFGTNPETGRVIVTEFAVMDVYTAAEAVEAIHAYEKEGYYSEWSCDDPLENEYIQERR